MKKGSLDNILQLTKASMFAIVFERKSMLLFRICCSEVPVPMFRKHIFSEVKCAFTFYMVGRNHF